VLALVLLISQLAAKSYADAPVIEVLPIVKEGTPGDLLQEDPVVPSRKGQTQLNSGTGSIQNALENQLSVPISDSGKPGNLSQIRGIGSNSQDMDVQTFGVSLSPPQGLGFDLSSFPQFLWGGFRFQTGPSLNGLNPSATAGTLALEPWTLTALQRPESTARASEFFNTVGVNQISASAKVGSTAMVLGYSSEKTLGPSGIFSQVWKSGKYSGAFHLLATDLDSETPGPTQFYAPRARTRTTRVLPVLQNDFDVGESSKLKTSLFFDTSTIDYTDPGSSFSSRTDTSQLGVQTAFLSGPWKLGLSAKEINYSSDLFRVPTQTQSNMQVSHLVELGTWTLDPNLQASWTTGVGMLPQGSLGARKDWNQGREALYTRLSYSQRVPTLAERFAIYPGYVGNPNLKNETHWTGVLGAEWSHGDVSTALESAVQWKQDVTVINGTQPQNSGDAYVGTLTLRGSIKISRFVDWRHALTLAYSRMTLTGFQYPYLPWFMKVGGLSVHSAGDLRKWEWITNLRGSSARVYDLSGDTLPGYFLFDTSLSALITKRITWAGRIENLLGTTYQVIQGYPIDRSFSMFLTAEL